MGATNDAENIQRDIAYRKCDDLSLSIFNGHFPGEPGLAGVY